MYKKFSIPSDGPEQPVEDLPLVRVLAKPNRCAWHSRRAMRAPVRRTPPGGRSWQGHQHDDAEDLFASEPFPVRHRRSDELEDKSPRIGRDSEHPVGWSC
jgi:hypothetical protein